MSDDLHDNNSAEKDKPEDSASAIFAAIMREAAEKAKPRSAPAAKETSPLASQESSSGLMSDSAAGTGEGDAVDEELTSDQETAAAPEGVQRIRRIPRQQLRRRPGTGGAFGGFIRTLFVVCISTGLVATLLTWFTSPEFLNPAVVQGLQLNDELLLAGVAGSYSTPTPVATPKWHYRIGIISGHHGRDSGAVCEDRYGNADLLESDVNFPIAQRVVANLKADNFAVDLLDENDPRLDNYQATALVSIHANTCQDFGERVSGFIIAKAAARPDHGADAFLRECVAINFGALVPIERSFVLTEDMTNYHVFRNIHPLTPAVILEMGYMLADREVLTDEPDLLAHAITRGIHCFLGASGDVPGLASSSADLGYLVPELDIPTPEGNR